MENNLWQILKVDNRDILHPLGIMAGMKEERRLKCIQ